MNDPAKTAPKKHETQVDRALEDTFPASDPPAMSGQKTREERERRDAKEKSQKPSPSRLR
jgi:hypothetical protein